MSDVGSVTPTEEGVAKYLANLGSKRARTVRSALDMVARELGGLATSAERFDWTRIGAADLERFRAMERLGGSRDRAKLYFEAVRGLLRTCAEIGIWCALSPEDVPRVGPRAPGTSHLPRGICLGPSDVNRLLTSCAREKRVSAIRDFAILVCIVDAMLTSAELLALNTADYDALRMRLLIRSQTSGEPSVVSVNERLAVGLASWLAQRGPESGPLFTPVLRGEHVRIRRLGQEMLRQIVSRRASAAGLPNVSAQSLRRSAIAGALTQGKEQPTVQLLARHASLEVTKRYVRPPDRRGPGRPRKKTIDIEDSP